MLHCHRLIRPPSTTLYHRMFTHQHCRMSTKPQIHHTIDSIRTALATHGTHNHHIGLVPTMGALHAGHIDLVKRSTQHADVTVVSIYVNPTQFGANEDLSSYPRTLDNDIQVLTQHNVQHIFLPTNAVMYPTTDRHGKAVVHSTWIDNDKVNTHGEGATRPTHFRGVCTVVAKLFNIIQPRTAYFGAKDGLQCCVIKKMVSDLNIPVQIEVVPTHRATDGLALSSRNVYLSDVERAEAPVLYKSLVAAQLAYCDDGVRDVKQLKQIVSDVLSSGKLGKTDYVEICDADTGNEDDSSQLSDTAEYMVAIAYKLGKPRLIDNCILSMSDKSKRI